MEHIWKIILARPGLAILIGVLVCCIFGAGLRGLTLNASYNAYFDADDPILRQHRDLQSTFSTQDRLLIALAFDTPIALGPGATELLNTLRQNLLALEVVENVSSVFDLGSNDETDFDDLDLELFNLDTAVEVFQSTPSIGIHSNQT